jgi:hypothetical protein
MKKTKSMNTSTIEGSLAGRAPLRLAMFATYAP